MYGYEALDFLMWTSRHKWEENG